MISLTLLIALVAYTAAQTTVAGTTSAAAGTTTAAAATTTGAGEATGEGEAAAGTCSEADTCTKCAEMTGCTYCAGVNKREVTPAGTCFETTGLEGGKCPTVKSVEITSKDKCLFDLNKACEAKKCGECVAATGCWWCDSGAAVTGGLVKTGSCNFSEDPAGDCLVPKLTPFADDSKCPKEDPCTANEGCMACIKAEGCSYCQTGETRETKAISSACITTANLEDGKCSGTQSLVSKVEECLYEQNLECEKNEGCSDCIDADNCYWCDTGGALSGGLLNTGSCNYSTKEGGDCIGTVKPTTDKMECNSASTLFAAASILIVAVSSLL